MRTPYPGAASALVGLSNPAVQLREALEGLLSIIAYDDENPCGFLIAETERIKAQNLVRALASTTTPAPVDEERDR